MKYWFFNGEDVVGPLLPQQLASRPDFLATSLICPEHASKEAESWQFASRFAEFHFDEVTGKLAILSAPETSPSPVLRPRKHPKKPAKPIASDFIRLSKIKQKEQPPTPVALATEGEVDLILPESANNSVPVQHSEPEKSATVQETQIPDSAPGASAKKTSSTQGETWVPSCVLPVVPEYINEGNLPLLPEGDGTYTAAVAEPGFGWEEDIFRGAAAPVEQKEAETVPASSAKQPQEQPAELSQETPQAVEEDMPLKDNQVEPKVSQIKARLIPTPEIEEFLTDRQLAFTSNQRHKSYSRLALILLVVLLVPGVVVLLLQAGGCMASATSKEVPASVAEKPLLAQESVEELTQAPASTSSPAFTSQQENALAAVQNHILPKNRGTIASYLDKLYQDRLQQGYTASWSVEPLHNNIYIVKYRVAKTRTEPIVYVFQADAKNNRLAGALNNAALDLVGKI